MKFVSTYFSAFEMPAGELTRKLKLSVLRMMARWDFRGGLKAVLVDRMKCYKNCSGRNTLVTAFTF